jgi:hypothetical protein
MNQNSCQKCKAGRYLKDRAPLLAQDKSTHHFQMLILDIQGGKFTWLHATK